MQPKLINYSEAKNEFVNGNVIYIQLEGVETGLLPETSANTIMLRSDCKDASLNMYMGNRNPIEIGLDNIISWIKERSNNSIAFYTRFSKEFYTIN